MTAALAIAGGIQLRAAGPADEAFIFNSWLKSYRSGSQWAKLVPGPIFFAEHHRAAERLLKRGRATVACSPQEAGQILGWALSEQLGGVPVLHYVFTKQVFRGLGVARTLLEAAGVARGLYTHRTPSGERLARALQLAFNPYLGGAVP